MRPDDKSWYQSPPCHRLIGVKKTSEANRILAQESEMRVTRTLLGGVEG